MTDAFPSPAGRLRFGLFQHRPPTLADGDSRVRVVFDMLRELTREEFDHAGDALGEIHRVLEGFDNDLDRAYEELVAARQDVLDGFTSSDAMTDVSSWSPVLRYRLVNFSVALVMHQTYVISEIGHIHGPESDASMQAKQEFAALYDASLGYRVMYGFRNAAVHSSRQLTPIYTRSALVVSEDGAEKVVRELKVRLAREAFALTRPNARLRDEVLALDEDPELFAMAENAYAEIKRVHQHLLSSLHPRREEAIGVLWPYLVECAAVGGYGPHFHTFGDGRQIQMGASSRSSLDYVYRFGIANRFEPVLILNPLVGVVEEDDSRE